MTTIGQTRVRIQVTHDPVQLVGTAAGGVDPLPEMGACWEIINSDASVLIPGSYPLWMTTSGPYIYAYIRGQSNTIRRWEFPSLLNEVVVYTYPVAGNGISQDTWPDYGPIIAYLDGKLYWTRTDYVQETGGWWTGYQTVLYGDANAAPINPTVLHTDMRTAEAAAAGLAFDELAVICANPVTHTLFGIRYRGAIDRSVYWSELVEINPNTGAVTARGGPGNYGGNYPNYYGQVFEYYGLTVDSSGCVWATAWDNGGPGGNLFHYDPVTGIAEVTPYRLEAWAGPAFFSGTNRGSLMYADAYTVSAEDFDYLNSIFEVFYDRSKIGEASPAPYLKVRRNCMSHKYPLAIYTFGRSFYGAQMGADIGDGPSLVSPDFSTFSWLRDNRQQAPGQENDTIAQVTEIQDVIPGGLTPATAGDLSDWGAGATSDLLPPGPVL